MALKDQLDQPSPAASIQTILDTYKKEYLFSPTNRDKVSVDKQGRETRPNFFAEKNLPKPEKNKPRTRVKPR